MLNVIIEPFVKFRRSKERTRKWQRIRGGLGSGTNVVDVNSFGCALALSVRQSSFATRYMHDSWRGCRLYGRAHALMVGKRLMNGRGWGEETSCGGSAIMK